MFAMRAGILVDTCISVQRPLVSCTDSLQLRRQPGTNSERLNIEALVAQ
jgi:hypothetical protein